MEQTEIIIKSLGGDPDTLFKEYFFLLFQDNYSSIEKTIVDENIIPYAHTIQFNGHPDEFKKNGLAVYQYCKFIMAYTYNKFGLDKTSIFLLLFRQPASQLIGFIRGSRVDVKDTEMGVREKNNQLGISTIGYPNLVPKDITNTDIPEWQHDGEVTCSVAYDNFYTNRKRIARLNNDYHGSLQCGISGSQQFILFYYLISIAISGKKYIDARIDLHQIYILCFQYLIGYGGHNIQETVVGLTTTIIVTYTFFKMILENVNQITNNKPENVIKVLNKNNQSSITRYLYNNIINNIQL